MSVQIQRYYGAGPTAVDITAVGLKHKAYDSYEYDATHPIQKPTSGNKYGFWTTIALYSDVLTEIYSDPKIYGGGVPAVPSPNPNGYVDWTGVTLHVGDECTDTYDRATGTNDDTGDEIVDNHDQVTAKTNFLITYTSINMKSVGLAGGGASLGPLSGVGGEQRISKYVFMQLMLGTTCAAGSPVPATIYFRVSVTS
jgi:hypothetical protein